MDVEAKIREHRSTEGSFGFLVEQISSLHKDLLAFQVRTEQHFARHDRRFDEIDGKFDNLDGRLGCIGTNLERLRADIRNVVAATMREVLREQKGKS